MAGLDPATQHAPACARETRSASPENRPFNHLFHRAAARQLGGRVKPAQGRPWRLGWRTSGRDARSS